MGGKFTSADATVASGGGAAITPSDTVDIRQTTNRLYVGGAGNIRVTLAGMAEDQFLNFTSVPVGTMLEIQVKRVWATGTTATNLLGLWP